MGRPTTFAESTKESIRLELSYLIKNGYLQKGKHISGVINWSNEDNIKLASMKIEIYCSDLDNWLRLVYQVTNRHTNEITNFDYKIYLETVKSNLKSGGDIFYFVCPESNKHCRVLYLAYGSTTFKSRTSYNKRIYYACQQVSKKDYSNTRYWTIEKDLNKLRKHRNTFCYKGEPTKRFIRTILLETKQDVFDYLRWSKESMTKTMWKDFVNQGFYVKTNP